MKYSEIIIYYIIGIVLLLVAINHIFDRFPDSELLNEKTFKFYLIPTLFFAIFSFWSYKYVNKKKHLKFSTIKSWLLFQAILLFASMLGLAIFAAAFVFVIGVPEGGHSLGGIVIFFLLFRPLWLFANKTISHERPHEF